MAAYYKKWLTKSKLLSRSYFFDHYLTNVYEKVVCNFPLDPTVKRAFLVFFLFLGADYTELKNSYKYAYIYGTKYMYIGYIGKTIFF